MLNPRKRAKAAFERLLVLAQGRGCGEAFANHLRAYITQASVPYNPANERAGWNLKVDDRRPGSIPAKVKDFAFAIDALRDSYAVFVTESKEEQLRHKTDVLLNQLRYQTKTTRTRTIYGHTYYYVHDAWYEEGPSWVVAFVEDSHRYFKIEPRKLFNLVGRKAALPAKNGNGYWIREDEILSVGGTFGELSEQVQAAM